MRFVDRQRRDDSLTGTVQYVGLDGAVIGIDQFGASAPAGKVERIRLYSWARSRSC